MSVGIFLVSEIGKGLGGAEKRFAGLFLELKRRGQDVRFVVHRSTLDALLANVEFGEIENYADSVVVLPADNSFRAKHARITEYAAKEFAPTDVLHFILYYPVLHRLPNPTIFSDVLSNMSMFTIRDHAMTHGAHLRSTIIDMLDPRRAAQTSKYMFWAGQKIQVTSNTFVNADNYVARPAVEKRNWIVFVGRFVPVKQVKEFVESIPVIAARCRRAGINDPKFFVLGHGTLESDLHSLAAGREFDGISLTIGYEPEPQETLSLAKVAVSLQKVTNYPSKSLAEMLSAGCVPVVTDVGTTRQMARPDFSYYVPESFTADELASRIVEVLTLDEEALASRSSAATAFARNELSIGKMADYYSALYARFEVPIS